MSKIINKKMNNLISIIIPVYNVNKYIEKCIVSLLAQTHDNFEAILIDDGSPDNSIEIAKSIIKGDPRFIFLSKENGGQGSARNMGIDLAKGEYITFLDSDDYIEPTFLQDMHAQLISTNADICVCNINVVNDNGNIIKSINNNPEAYMKKNDFLLCSDTISSFMWDKLFKKETFLNMRFSPDIRTYEDSHFVFRLLYGKKSHLYKRVYIIMSNVMAQPPTAIIRRI